MKCYPKKLTESSGCQSSIACTLPSAPLCHLLILRAVTCVTVASLVCRVLVSWDLQCHTGCIAKRRRVLKALLARGSMYVFLKIFTYWLVIYFISVVLPFCNSLFSLIHFFNFVACFFFLVQLFYCFHFSVYCRLFISCALF